uniref:Nephrin n=1 Tax=Trichogramma kaykai TaxID=54128 RepID=A0ABD2WLG2_9HYME
MSARIKLSSSCTVLQCIILLCMSSFPHSDSSNVVSRALPQSFRVRPSNSSVLEGGEITLQCEVNHRVGIVQWVKDGFAYVILANGDIVGHPRWRIEGEQSMGVYNLHIRNASLSDDGEYQCQVGPNGRIKPIRTNAKLTVLSPPQSVEITSHQRNKKIEIKQNQSLRLECIVRSAKPAAGITWYRGNVQLKGGESSITASTAVTDDKDKDHKDGKNVKFDTHGYLEIMTTSDDDEISYTCEAVHPAVPVTKPMRAHAVLSVFYPPGAPYIEGYVEGETLRRGQQIELACKSRGGNPAAQVIWYRNGETVHSVYTTEGKVSKNVYSFIAQPSDDKARFECKVTNVMSVTPMSTHVDLTVLFAPATVKLEGPTEARAEERVTISCVTDISNPASEIKWVVDNQKIESTQHVTEAAMGGFITSSNITFTINKMAQRAVVVCHANNIKLSETIVGTQTINVIYPPSRLEMSGYEAGTAVLAGSVLKLSCTAISGNPLATITWYKNDNKVRKKVTSVTKQRDHAVTSELALVVNASDNKANIRCEASNSATQVPLVQSAVLNVNFLPDTVKISTIPKDFKAGERGRLLCESTSSNPKAEMSWWKAGSPVLGTNTSTKAGLYGGIISQVELALDLTEDMNGEEYTCQAKISDIDRSVHDTTKLNILYKPVFENLEATELVGMEGEPFVISVAARGNPAAITYSWTRDGLPLSSNVARSRITARGSTLNITRLERLDAGTYVCEAINDRGQTFYHLNLTVQYPTTIKSSSTSGLVYPTGKEAKLFCEIEGSPIGPNYVTWFKENVNVAELGDRYLSQFINKTAFLTIRTPSKEDVGEYRCNINNGINNVTSEPILFITNFGPEMANTPLTKKAAVNNGANAQLYCKARGSPLPHFTWVYNGKTIMPNRTENKYSLTYTNLSVLYSQSILTVYKVEQSDYGKYECIAQNKYGQDLQTVGLDVTSPPDEPVDLEAHNITHNSVTLAWKSGFDGGLSTSYQIRWREARDDETNYHYLDVSPGTHRAVVDHLELGTYYVFSIRARNTKGESPFLPDLLKVQTLREAPPNELIVSEINSSYLIVIIIAVSAFACLLIATPIVYTALVSKKKAQRSGINKSQTADMYAPSTVNGDTMTGELSSVSDEKSDVNFDANDYVDEGRKTAASTYLIDPTLSDYGKSGLEMQVHQQSTLNRRSNHLPSILSMDSPPQRISNTGTLTASKSSYIGNPSPAPPADVNFYSVEMESGRYMGYESQPSPAQTSTILESVDPGAYYPSLSPSAVNHQLHHPLHQHPHAHLHHHHHSPVSQHSQGVNSSSSCSSSSTTTTTTNNNLHHHLLNNDQSPSTMALMGTVGVSAAQLGVHQHQQHQQLGSMQGTLTRQRTLPRPVPPPDVTVMTAGTKSPLPPTVPPPPATFARAGPIPALSLGHQLSTFTSTPQYSDIDGHLV